MATMLAAHIAQQCDASYCEQAQAQLVILPLSLATTRNGLIDYACNGKQSHCCPKDLGPHQSAKAATAVVPIRRLLQEIQP